jgi:beta-mannosidase
MCGIVAPVCARWNSTAYADQWGESFQFVVNGRAIFAKGANWIPAHSFVTEVSHAMYDDLLSSAVTANMNMLRIWGGGIYEMDEFYDLCDEKACSCGTTSCLPVPLIHTFDEFLAQVEAEANYQVKRLHHRACLALWCGNNEIEMMPLPRERFQNSTSAMLGYKELFYRLLPEVVAANDGVTPYWPSSPHDPIAGPESAPTANTMISHAGDIHYWGVWHAKNPVKDYEKTQYRFCSEFGMQSYPSPEVAQTFCPESELNIFSPVFENHQKNGGGNATIFHYISHRYRFPDGYKALSYLSQLNQAYCMKVGVEHWRRSMPQCMGALYWQLNDCWPVASWSSIEFGGRWKALNFEARRFFAPALVSAHVPGDIKYDKHNFAHNSIREAYLYTTYDGLEPRDATLRWTLFYLENGVVADDSMPVRLVPGESLQHRVLDCSEWMQQHGAENIVLRLSLEADDEILSQNTVFLTLPRLTQLPLAPIKLEVAQNDAGETIITASSPVFQHQVQLDPTEAAGARWSDNFFDLYPDRPHTVTLKHNAALSIEDIKRQLSAYSLVNTYR